MKNILRVFLLFALAFIANKVLFSDLEFNQSESDHTIVLTATE